MWQQQNQFSITISILYLNELIKKFKFFRSDSLVHWIIPVSLFKSASKLNAINHVEFCLEGGIQKVSTRTFLSPLIRKLWGVFLSQIWLLHEKKSTNSTSLCQKSNYSIRTIHEKVQFNWEVCESLANNVRYSKIRESISHNSTNIWHQFLWRSKAFQCFTERKNLTFFDVFDHIGGFRTHFPIEASDDKFGEDFEHLSTQHNEPKK